MHLKKPYECPLWRCMLLVTCFMFLTFGCACMCSTSHYVYRARTIYNLNTPKSILKSIHEVMVHQDTGDIYFVSTSFTGGTLQNYDAVSIIYKLSSVSGMVETISEPFHKICVAMNQTSGKIVAGVQVDDNNIYTKEVNSEGDGKNRILFSGAAYLMQFINSTLFLFDGSSISKFDGNTYGNIYSLGINKICSGTRDGYLYFTTSNYQLKRLSPKNEITTVAGISGVSKIDGDGGPAENASFGSASDCSISITGEIYIMDGSRVRKIFSNNTITTALDVNGAYIIRGMDSHNEWLIFSTNQNTILKLYPNGTVEKVLDLSKDLASSLSEVGASNYKSSAPYLDFKWFNRLLLFQNTLLGIYFSNVGDSSSINCMMKLILSDTIQKATSPYPQVAAIQFAISSGNLFLLNINGKTITKYNLETYTQSFITFDSAKSGPMVISEKTQDIYIVNDRNPGSALYKIPFGTQTPILIAGTDQSAYSYRGENGSDASQALFYNIRQLYLANVIQPDGSYVEELYIADYNRIRMIRNNSIYTIAGTSQIVSKSSPDGSIAVNSPLFGYISSGLFVTSRGVVYFIEKAIVRKVENGILTTVAGNGQSEGFISENTIATVSSFMEPYSLVVNETDNTIIVANLGSLIKLSPECAIGFYGTNCSQFDCFGYSDNHGCNNGVCQSPDYCQCYSNYFGSNCNITKCFGILSNETNTCSGYGSCNNFDQCICNSGRIGKDCSFNSSQHFDYEISTFFSSANSLQRSGNDIRSIFFDEATQELYFSDRSKVFIMNITDGKLSLFAGSLLAVAPKHQPGRLAQYASFSQIYSILKIGTDIMIYDSIGTCFIDKITTLVKNCEETPYQQFVSPYSKEIFGVAYNNYIFKKTGKNDTLIAGKDSSGDNSFKEDSNPLETKISPFKLCFSQDGSIYFTEYGTFRIRKLEATTGKIKTVAGDGVEGIGEDGIDARQSKVRFPISCYVSPSDEIYFTDYNRLRKIYSNGTITTVYQYEYGYFLDFTMASDGWIYIVSSITTITKINPEKNIVIQDFISESTRPQIGNFLTLGRLENMFLLPSDGMGRIKMIFMNNGTVNTEPPATVLSQYVVGTNSISNLNNEKLLLATTYIGLMLFDIKSQTVSQLNPTSFAHIAYSTFTNSLYAVLQSSNTQIVKLSSDFSTYSTFSGDSISKHVDLVPAIDARYQGITCLFIWNGNNSTEEIYICDTYSIRKIKDGMVSVVVGGYIKENDQFYPPYICMNCTISPSSIYVTKSKTIYFTDTKSQLIYKMEENGILQVIAGGYELGFTGDFVEPALSALLNYPHSIYVDEDNDSVYFIDGMQRIRKLEQTICAQGWTGDCSIPICDGLLSTDAKSCARKGDCVLPDVCSCFEPNKYSGSSCNITKCFGEFSNYPSVCSYHGECIDFNECTCKQNYLGDICNITKCFGILSNDTTVCNSNGKCTDFNYCQCNSGWDGTNCSIPICNGIPSNSTQTCNSRGKCIAANSCQCNYGYFGNSCELFECYSALKSDFNVCSSHGKCVAFDRCECEAEYQGNDCSVTYCNNILSNNSHVCSSRGSCLKFNNCSCFEPNKYSGSSCNITKCFGEFSNYPSVCSYHGECIDFNQCRCYFNYFGSNCNITKCFGILSNETNTCSGNGECISFNECKCKNGWTGESCSIPICYGKLSNDSTVCSSSTQGTCISPDDCQCKSGYSGFQCEEYSCFGLKMNSSNVCSSKGDCAAPNSCQCNSDYFGSNCEINKCFGELSNSSSVCSSHGMCDRLDNCKCESGWTGQDCSIPICGGVAASDPSVCSSHGLCTVVNTCNCYDSYYGEFCQSYNTTANDFTIQVYSTNNENLYYVNPTEDLILKCLVSTEKSVSYIWSMSYESSESTKSYLIVPSSILQSRKSIQVTVQVTADSITKTITKQVKVNEAPTIGTFSIAPSFGYTLETFFKLECNDSYDANLPLTYKFIYKLDTESEWKTLSEQSIEKSFSTSLPEGNQQIAVLVYDSFMSYTQSNTITVKVSTKTDISIEALAKIETKTISIPIISSLSNIISTQNSTNAEVTTKAVQIVSNYFTTQLEKESTTANITSSKLSASVSSVSSVSKSFGYLNSNGKNVVMDYFKITLQKATISSVTLSKSDYQTSLKSLSEIEKTINSRKRVQQTIYSKIISVYKLLSEMGSKSLLEDSSPNKIEGKVYQSYSKYLKGYDSLIDTLSGEITVNMTSPQSQPCIVDVKTYVNELVSTEFKYSKVFELTLQNPSTFKQIDISKSNPIAKFKFHSSTTRSIISVQKDTICQYQTSSGSFTSDYCEFSYSDSGELILSVSRTGLFVVSYQEVTITPTTSQVQTSSTSSSNGNSAMIIGISVGVPVAVLLIVGIAIVIIVACFLKRRKSKSNNLEMELTIMDTNNISIGDEPVPEPFIIPPEQISTISKLGEKLYKSELTLRTTGEKKIVAVQHVNGKATSPNEFMYLKEVDHQNVVHIHGISTLNNQRVIVREYVEGLSLQEMINQMKSGQTVMDFDEKFDLLLQVARGVNYLHKLPNRVIHGNLKPSNCLIERNDMSCKVCDFGLSKLLSSNNTDSSQYLANELISGNSQNLSTSVDAYSFGIIMWEILFEENPYEYRNADKFFFETDFQTSAYFGLNSNNFLPSVANGLRPVIPFNQENAQKWLEQFHRSRFTVSTQVLLSMKHLMESCWHADSSHRPSFETIIKEISQIRNKLEYNMSVFV